MLSAHTTPQVFPAIVDSCCLMSSRAHCKDQQILSLSDFPMERVIKQISNDRCICIFIECLSLDHAPRQTKESITNATGTEVLH